MIIDAYIDLNRIGDIVENIEEPSPQKF